MAKYRWDLSGPAPRLVLDDRAPRAGILASDPSRPYSERYIPAEYTPEGPVSAPEGSSQTRPVHSPIIPRESSGEGPQASSDLLRTAGQVSGLEDFLPGQTLDERLQPRTRPTSWGTDFTTRPGRAIESVLPGPLGAVARIGGEISRRNLERVYDEALAEHAPTGETNPDYLQEAYGGGATQTWAPGATTNFYAPGDVPGVRTPIATHEGFIPGTRVVSGNTDLITGLSPREGQSAVFADEVDAFAQERIRAEQEQAALAAAEEAERERIRQEQEAAAAARLAEIEQRRVREAAEQARAEAQRQANIRAANEELARRNREREESGQAQQQGRAVTDRHGNPVRDSGGGIVTDRPTERDSGGDSGGGGGGGTWCCTAAQKHGMPIKKIKELRKWHRQQSEVWQNGYDRWGYYIAEKLVRKSKFWAEVTEAGHDWFVNRYYTPKGALAWAVIVPGSYIAGWLDAIQK